MINWLHQIDQQLFLILNSFHHSLLDPFMLFFSGQLIWIPFVGFFFWYSYRKRGKFPTLYFGLFLLMALAASDVTSSYILKNTFSRLRPCKEIDLQPLIYNFGQRCGGRYGFVSSHAANAVALVFFSLRTLPFGKIMGMIWLIPLFVSFSRIYLGVHYPGDILGGTLVGLLWGLTFSWMYNSMSGGKSDDVPA